MEYQADAIVGFCANHPERPMAGTCSRCGDYLCLECGFRVEDGTVKCIKCWTPVILADIGARFGANLLDSMVVAFPGVMLMILVAMASSPDTADLLPLFFVVSLPVGGIIQIAVMALDPWHRSVAKRALGIRVALPDGRVPSMVRLVLLRNVLVTVIGSVPGIGPIFRLVDALFIFGNDRRCLHDQIAGTVVVQFDPNQEPKPE